MTIKTFRDILREYADTGELDDQYVSLGDYEASQNKLYELLTINNDTIKALLTSASKLEDLLQRWQEIAPELSDFPHWESYQGQSLELQQLIADTQAAIGGTNEPVNQ